MKWFNSQFAAQGNVRGQQIRKLTREVPHRFGLGGKIDLETVRNPPVALFEDHGMQVTHAPILGET